MEVSEPHKNTYGPREFEHMLYDVIDTQRWVRLENDGLAEIRAMV